MGLLKTSNPKTNFFRWVALCLLLLLVITNDVRLIIAVHEKNSPPIILILLFYGTTLGLLPPLLLNRNVVVRTFMQILLFSAFYTDLLYLLLSHYPFSFPDALNLFNNPEYASGAINTFQSAFVITFAGAALVYALFYAATKGITPIFHPAWAFGFVGFILLFYVTVKSHPGLSDFFPAPYRVAGNLLTANRFRPEEQWRRALVREKPTARQVRHIFLIVDESITGTALSLNGFSVPTTPTLRAHESEIINFGVATSFSNYSAGSNLALLSGLRLRDLPDEQYTAFAKPSLFGFAKAAGYQTFLLDGQASGKKLQNYTTENDLRFIDSVYRPGVAEPDAPLYNRDMALADKISDLVKSKTPTFVYVNKAGAHWPYSYNYPPELKPPLFQNPIPVAENESYLKSIVWNVDRFWKFLLGRTAQDSNFLILYTSDHGEAYNAPSYRIKHASIYNSAAIEGLVPLIALDKAQVFPSNFQPQVNRYSHGAIFPTLLVAMGFDSSFVHRSYGSSLLEPPPAPPRWFLTGDLFGRGKNNKVTIRN